MSNVNNKMNPAHKQDKKYNRQCVTAHGTFKEQIEDEDTAIELAALLSYKTEQQVNAYVCKVCSYYHVGRESEI